MIKKFLVALLLLSSAAPACAQMDALMQQAREKLGQSDYKGAIAPLTEGLSIARARNQREGIADFSYFLGIAYDSLGENEKAIRLYQEALDVNVSLGGHKLEQANILGSMGIVWKNRGDTKKALELELRGLRMAEETGDKETIGRAYANLAVVYSVTSDHAKALEYNAKALEIQTALGDKYGMQIDLANMAQEHTMMGNYAKALELLGKSKALAEELNDASAKASVAQGYATVYFEQGDYQKQIAFSQQQLDLARQAGDKRFESGALGDLASAYDSLYDFPKSLELNLESQRITDQLNDPLLGSRGLNNIGIVYMKMGDYKKALEYYERALAQKRSIGDRAGECGTTTNIADIYARQGDLARAVETNLAVKSLCESSGDRKALGQVYRNLGDEYKSLGDFAKAAESVQRSLEIDKELQVSTKDNDAVAADIAFGRGDAAAGCAASAKLDDDMLKARCLQAKGDSAGAEQAFAKVLAEASGKRIADDVVGAGIGLCLSLEKQKKAAPARKACEDAIAAVERQRELLPVAARGRFLSVDIQGFPRIAAYATRALVRSTPADGFFWAENAKARAFIEALSAKSDASKRPVDAEVVRRRDAAAAKVAGVYAQMDQAFEKKNTEHYKKLEGDLAAAKKAEDDLIAELRRSQPAYAAVEFPQPVAAADLALKPGEVLIEFVVTGSRAAAFVVDSKKAVAVYDIPLGKKALTDLVSAFRKPFEQPLGPDGKFAGKFDALSGGKLYAALLKPALAADPKTGKSLVPKGSKLIIVPDGVLGLLPFEALVTGPKRYLGDDWDVAYAQSGTALTLQRALSAGGATGSGLLVVADPVFDKGDARLKGTGLEGAVSDVRPVTASIMKHMGVGGSRQAGFERLEETGVMAEALKGSFAGEASLLTGRDASKSKLLAEDLSRYKYLVLATHGILDSEVPYIREPALVLTQVGLSSGDDGYLLMSEVMGLKLKADMVALTACKTGLGKELDGEGVLGLGRAFQYAGAKNALVSLWSVSEKSTTQLTKVFFEGLKAGKTPREALKAARAFARKGGFDHPFFWAPFVLVGS